MAWDKGFFTVSTEFSTFPRGNGGCRGRQCGKVRGQEGAKKNFLAGFGKKYPKMDFPAAPGGKTRAFRPSCPHFYLRFPGNYGIMQIYCAKIGVLAQAPGIPAAHSQREKDRWPICKKTEKSASRSRSPGAQTSSRGATP